MHSSEGLGMDEAAHVSVSSALLHLGDVREMLANANRFAAAGISDDAFNHLAALVAELETLSASPVDRRVTYTDEGDDEAAPELHKCANCGRTPRGGILDHDENGRLVCWQATSDESWIECYPPEACL